MPYLRGLSLTPFLPTHALPSPQALYFPHLRKSPGGWGYTGLPVQPIPLNLVLRLSPLPTLLPRAAFARGTRNMLSPFTATLTPTPGYPLPPVTGRWRPAAGRCIMPLPQRRWHGLRTARRGNPHRLRAVVLGCQHQRTLRAPLLLRGVRFAGEVSSRGAGLSD